MENRRSHIKKTENWPTITRPAIFCAAAGFLLYAVLMVAKGEDGTITALDRAPHGEGEMQYEIKVRGLMDSDEELEVTVPVGERQYTNEEANELYDSLFPELVTAILGDNESLEAVRTDLNLRQSMEPYGFAIEWESEEPGIIDSFGTVHNEGLPEAGRQFFLKALMTDGLHEREFELRVTVLPPVLTEAEQAVRRWLEVVKRTDKKQLTEETLALPETLDDKKLQYTMNSETDYRILPFLGILLAALLSAREKVNQENETKKRERLLLLDYSEIVSKLMVFTGAGLTIRTSWELITEGYENAVKSGNKEKRPAYEEMRHAAAQLASGASEGMIYGEFGRRCGLQPYIKLAALLEQNRKTGSKNLRAALELEMAAAFEQRKNLAKKLGEEAGTKLLLPLFLMLGIVMVMIVVPAFLAFY